MLQGWNRHMNSKIRSSVHNIFTYIEVLHTEIKYQNDRYQEWSEGDFKPRKKPAYQIARCYLQLEQKETKKLESSPCVHVCRLFLVSACCVCQERIKGAF